MIRSVITIFTLLCLHFDAISQEVVSFNAETMERNDKTLIVKEVKFNTAEPSIAEIDSMFRNSAIDFNNIDVENWGEYDYRPSVKFRIAYSSDEIYIQYYVKEMCVKAVYGEDDGALPYKDSCFEFFCIPAGDGVYYNLELNCIAKGTFAGGADRKERTRYKSDVLSQIRRHSTLGEKAFGTKTSDNEPFEYTITVALPVRLFSLSEVKPLKGRTIRANFYNCGDEMPIPHYYSWNPIGTQKPNFHTPEYFGYLKFE